MVELPIEPSERAARIDGAGGARPGSLLRAAGLFAGLLVALAVAYCASALLFADLGALRDPADPARFDPRLRFNATIALIFGYSVAAFYLGRLWMLDDFAALRPVVEASETEWRAWHAALVAPPPGPLLRAVALGALAGLFVNFATNALGSQVPMGAWRGHVVWIWLLNPLLFAALGVLTHLSTSAGRFFREAGRRARIELIDPAPLAPFSRAGLRLAGLWLVGNSLASLLFVSASEPVVVAAVLVFTIGIGVASLIFPSRGVHERMRSEKRRELTLVRGEIGRARESLIRPSVSAADAAGLPALLAWEARVERAPEWPFDASTWMRFALFLLVPLGSWLGGALVERIVDAWVG